MILEESSSQYQEDYQMDQENQEDKETKIRVKKKFNPVLDVQEEFVECQIPHNQLDLLNQDLLFALNLNQNALKVLP